MISPEYSPSSNIKDLLSRLTLLVENKVILDQIIEITNKYQQGFDSERELYRILLKGMEVYQNETDARPFSRHNHYLQEDLKEFKKIILCYVQDNMRDAVIHEFLVKLNRKFLEEICKHN
jgi:hypothetical protein